MVGRRMRRDVFADDSLVRGESNSPNPSPKQDRGAICVRWVRCGRSWCRCMSGGAKHGPYYARCWWEGGMRRKAYVRKGEATEAVVACAERRQADRAARAKAEANRQEWRRIRALIKEVEHGGY